jgi:hypothetical protein
MNFIRVVLTGKEETAFYFLVILSRAAESKDPYLLLLRHPR